MAIRKGTSHRSDFKLRCWGALLSGSCLWAVPAAAQVREPEALDAGAEDIVVTATRRDEALQDIPLSIQAVTGEQLRRAGAETFEDYARTVAGVSFISNGPGRNQIFIRGVSTGGDVDTGKEATIGVYIDETPVTEGSSQPDLRLFDIARVEVLRGPQGTLYGSGSLGGTVRVITNVPQFDEVAGFLEGQVSTTRSGGTNPMGNGWLNLPLSPSTAVRLVAYGVHNEGFLNNGFTGARNINDEDTYGGRVAVRTAPSETLDLTLTGTYQHTRVDAQNRATDVYPRLVLNQSAPEPFEDRYAIVNLTGKLDLGFATLTSSTSYFDRRRTFENDVDYFLALFGIPRGRSIYDYGAKSFAHEFRLASAGDGAFRWLVGAFYLSRKEDFLQTINPRGVAFNPTPGLNVFFFDTAARTEQVAGFGEANLEPTPGLTLTGGVRVSRVDRSNTSEQAGALGGFARSGSFDETAVTPKINLSYEASPDALIYVQAAKGFRIGGVNPGLPPCGAGCVTDVGPSFDSDSLWNYEVGAKLALLGGRLTVNTAAFWIDWSNIQLNVQRGDGFNGFLNAGKARSRGVEVEANIRVNENLRLGGQLTYTDATLRSLPPGLASLPGAGTRLPDIPRWSIAANAELGTPVGQSGRAYLRGDVQYVGDRLAAFSATPLRLDDYLLLNLRIGFDQGANSFSLFATNLTDERAQLSRNQFAGVRDGAPISFDRITINTPRTIGVRLSHRF